MSKLIILVTLTMAAFSVHADKGASSGCVLAGNAKAQLTIEEYSDFECPYCAKGHESIKEVLKNYEGKVKVVYKNLPLPFHSHAMPAAKVFTAICLQDPEKALAWQSEVFSNQNRLSEGESFLFATAEKVGVNIKKLKKDVESKKVAEIIKKDGEDAAKYSFRGTPSFLVGDVPLQGAYPYDEFKRIIDKQLESH